jgi:hypothetical protein
MFVLIAMAKFVQILYAMGPSSPDKEDKGLPMEKAIHSGTGTFLHFYFPLDTSLLFLE